MIRRVKHITFFLEGEIYTKYDADFNFKTESCPSSQTVRSIIVNTKTMTATLEMAGTGQDKEERIYCGFPFITRSENENS